MVNIGNAGKTTSGEKKILSKEVMLTADELEALKELTELYPDTFSREHRQWKRKWHLQY